MKILAAIITGLALLAILSGCAQQVSAPQKGAASGLVIYTDPTQFKIKPYKVTYLDHRRGQLLAQKIKVGMSLSEVEMIIGHFDEQATSLLKLMERTIQEGHFMEIDATVGAVTVTFACGPDKTPVVKSAAVLDANETSQPGDDETEIII
jgi:hypothetical protein